MRCAECWPRWWTTDGRVQVPGFYDDVVPLTDTERKQFRRAAVRRERVHAADRRRWPVAAKRATTTLERRWARPDLRYQRPVERLSRRRGEDGSARPGQRQIQLPPGAESRSAARSAPRWSACFASDAAAGHQDGIDRHARRTGHRRAAGQSVHGRRGRGDRAGLQRASRCSSAKGARSRSSAPSTISSESTRCCWAGAWTTTTPTARTKNSAWPISTAASTPAPICGPSWRRFQSRPRPH